MMNLTDEQKKALENYMKQGVVTPPPAATAPEMPQEPTGLPETPEVLPAVDEPAIPGPLSVTDEPPAAEPVPDTTPSITPTAGVTVQDLMTPFNQEAESTRALGTLTEQEAEARQPLIENRSTIVKDYNDKYQKIVDAAAADTKEELSRIDTLVKEQQDEKYEGFWQNKSTGTKILGALSVALGAYAQGLSGGKVPNTAAKIINDAMAQDFEMFRVNSNKKIQLINQSRASLSAKQAATREELARQDAYKVSQLGQIEQKLMEIGNKFKGKKAGEQANIMASQVEQRKNQLVASLLKEKEAAKAAQAKLKLEELKDTEKTEMTLAKEYRSHPEVKKTNAAETSLQAMRNAPGDSAGDITLLFNFMRSQDPTSTVRESEFDLGKNTGGVLEMVQNIIPGFTEGTLLTPEQRKQIINAAESAVNAQRKTLSKINNEYRETAKRFGLNSDKILGNPPPAPTKTNPVTPPPHGAKVKQNGKTYVWDGAKYVESGDK